MKDEHKIVYLIVSLGLFVWVIDAFIDSIIFYKQPFFDSLIYDVPIHEIYMRSFSFACFCIFGIVVSIMITKRKQSEEALRESEEKYRLLVKNLPGIVYQGYKDWSVEFIDKKVELLTGNDVDEFNSKKIKWSDIIIKDDIETARKSFIQALKTDKSYTREYRIKSKSGGIHWIQERGQIICSEKGEILCVTGVFFDITDVKKAEEHRTRLATAIEQAGESIIITDKDATIQYVNPAFERITGYGREEAMGQNPRILQSGKQGKSFYASMWATLLRREVWSGRLINKKKDGTFFEEESSISPVLDKTGKITNYVAVKRDVTQEVALEAQLQQSQKIQSIGTLAGGIAHDFNNILYPIIGYTEMAIDDVPEDSLIKRNLKEVLKATKRARDLVQQILTFSRQNDRELKPLKFQSIVKEAMKLLRASIPSTITINQNINNDCGTIRGDQTQIHQIVMNLCTNAYQSMEETGGQLELSLDEIAIGPDAAIEMVDMKPGRYARLTVSDTGHGMEPVVLEKIFDPYFTTKEPDKGTGLGLSVVHGIVNTHGGHISASSEPGQGTKFDVYLPLFESAEIEAETVSPETLATGKEHILLVDDENQIVDVVRQMLERLGYQVTVRTSSIEALEAFRHSPDKFDLVITDMTMPNMTGIQLSQKLLEIKPDIPIIICTGFSTKVDNAKAKTAGIRGFVMKPVVMREIAKKIRGVLDQE